MLFFLAGIHGMTGPLVYGLWPCFKFTVLSSWSSSKSKNQFFAPFLFLLTFFAAFFFSFYQVS